MESRAIEVKCKRNPSIVIRCIPGHFATNHSHINYYVDLTQLKTGQKEATMVAENLASGYDAIPIDTIIATEDTQAIAAFLAQRLSSTGSSVNYGSNINILVPEYNSNSQMIFRDNTQKMIWGKRVLLIIASATTGKTIERALDCINYYGGEAVGVGAIFSAADEIAGFPIISVFRSEDVPGYESYPYKDCPSCKRSQKIDAIVNAYGYSKI